MSGRGRGGRGGGRGGRGAFASAGRKTAPPGMPGGDDPGLLFNEQPQDTYPKFYVPPVAPPLNTAEARSVAAFVAFRRAFHSTPFYTHRHLINAVDDVATSKPADAVRRTYTQAQINARFAVKNRATIDPFVAVPMYSHKFVDETRTLPKLKARADPYVKDFFPEELWGTLDGKDTGGPKGGFLSSRPLKPKRGVKRKAVAMQDDDPFDSDEEDLVDRHAFRKRREHETDGERKARIEAALKDGEDEDENKGDVDLDDEDVELDDDEGELSQEDDNYDDDEGGDYDAEAYFDAGDADDYGDDEGIGESAMDF
ncbi:DNA-directed RNA polymerase III, subunit Rpc31 [Hypoxylon sp. NC1633]|nr:DNA-directed RNA polymerase III, subunit Rpc31 [Hypoxylon sp. NC1633]